MGFWSFLGHQGWSDTEGPGSGETASRSLAAGSTAEPLLSKTWYPGAAPAPFLEGRGALAASLQREGPAGPGPQGRCARFVPQPRPASLTGPRCLEFLAGSPVPVGPSRPLHSSKPSELQRCLLAVLVPKSAFWSSILPSSYAFSLILEGCRPLAFVQECIRAG